MKFVEPPPASLCDIARVHGREHIEEVKIRGIFRAASFDAGGAISAAELATEGEPAFALIRRLGTTHQPTGPRECVTPTIWLSRCRRLGQGRSEFSLLILISIMEMARVSIFHGDRNVRIVNPGSVDANFDYLTMDSESYLKQVGAAF
jgi:hypothetical protein